MEKRILIIIPCYNEEASLPSLVRELRAVTGYHISILAVNDCSVDNTAEVIAQCSVNALHLPVNLGIGGAMQSGFLYARENGFDIAIQVDGDGQHPPSELHKLIEHHLANGTNVVIGSRFLSASAFRSTPMRRIGIRYLHFLSRLLTGKKIYDGTSGFRLFDRKAIEVAAELYPDEYPEPESLVMFSKAGLSIEEVAVDMRPRQGGISSIRNFASFYYIVKVSIAMCYSFIRHSKK
ncbi:MAG: glycosyltransferase family 2 protein [Bacteroidetes bacterium]|nr:glycosyltransferase family 2 protein [Bacteroidota bacterium]